MSQVSRPPPGCDHRPRTDYPICRTVLGQATSATPPLGGLRKRVVEACRPVGLRAGIVYNQARCAPRRLASLNDGNAPPAWDRPPVADPVE